MSFPERLDEPKFLESLVMDSSRDAYNAMTADQKQVVRFAYLYGWLHSESEPKKENAP